MSIAARPFADSRNTYIVDNNDSSAFDKSYVGTPGTHTEQRCCGDRAPYMAPMYYNQVLRTTVPAELWCHECETAWEQAWEDTLQTFNEMTPFIRGVAMAISYVPVLGTAVSFVINASLNLAAGANISEAGLDAIGSALPGQPTSGMIYRAARSIANGERIDDTVIQTLPVDDSTKKTIKYTVSIAEDIINGKNITTVILDQIYTALPDNGKRAMALARRIANGEDIGSIAMSEAEKAGLSTIKNTFEQIKNTGPQAVNGFIAQAGYQGSLSTLPQDIRESITAGLISGNVEKAKILEVVQTQGTFNISEMNTASLDDLVNKGRTIINSGATWVSPITQEHKTLAEIRSGTSWRRTYRPYDGLEKRYSDNYVTTIVPINDVWRRGFDVGIAVNEGLTNTVDENGTPFRNKAQQNAIISLNMNRDGYAAAEQIQYERTERQIFDNKIKDLAVSAAKALSIDDRKFIEDKASTGQILAGNNQKILAARNLVNDGRYRWGFDIGTGLCRGLSETGPLQNSWRVKLGPYSDGSGVLYTKSGSIQAQQGFDVAQALQFGITKNPSLAQTGSLIATGIIKSGTSSEVKANVVAATVNNTTTKQAVSNTLNISLFRRILNFLHL